MSRPPEAQPVGHLVTATFGGLAFVASLVYFGLSYAGRFGVALGSVDSASLLRPIVTDAVLFSVFALHHSIFARTGLKTLVARFVPADLERSTYVWVASLLFIGVCAGWQPVAGTLWRLEGLWRDLAWAAQAVAGLATVIAARQLGVLRLAGIAQARTDEPPRLDATGLYALVRHPIYLAWLILVWAAPTMTATRAVFAGLSSLYLFLAVPFEEKDLHRLFGAAYAAYARRVRWRIVPLLF